MRKGQPDRADLLPACRLALEHAAGDDEVRARVVMREREAEPMVMDRGNDADERDRSGDPVGASHRRSRTDGR